MTRYPAATFGLCFLTAALLFSASPSGAVVTWRNMSPFYCSISSRDQQWPPSPYDYAIGNLSPTTDMAVACSITSDQDLNHRSGSSGVHSRTTILGSANVNGVTNACACVSYSAAMGGSCGNQTSIYSASAYSAELDTSAGSGSWAYTSVNDFPYVFMVLKRCSPSSGCTSYNTLRGYRMYM